MKIVLEKDDMFIEGNWVDGYPIEKLNSKICTYFVGYIPEFVSKILDDKTSSIIPATCDIGDIIYGSNNDKIMPNMVRVLINDIVIGRVTPAYADAVREAIKNNSLPEVVVRFHKSTRGKSAGNITATLKLK